MNRVSGVRTFRFWGNVIFQTLRNLRIEGIGGLWDKGITINKPTHFINSVYVLLLPSY